MKIDKALTAETQMLIRRPVSDVQRTTPLCSKFLTGVFMETIMKFLLRPSIRRWIFLRACRSQGLACKTAVDGYCLYSTERRTSSVSIAVRGFRWNLGPSLSHPAA